MMPAWLAEHIATTTGAPPGLRHAKAATCPRCGALVLTGLDDDVLAGHATVDPTPLDTPGEVLALAAGRATYDLTRRGGRYRLDRRDPWRIGGRPAGTGDADTLPDHRCGASLPAAPSNHDRPAHSLEDHHDRPPY